MSKERVALVTGVASEIGMAVARELAKTCRVVIGLDGNGADNYELNAWCVKQGTLYVSGLVDVTSEKSVAAAYLAAVGPSGRLDIVAHCSEVTPPVGLSHSTEGMSLEEWNRVIDANLTSTFLVCREAISYLERNVGGRIITMSSDTARAVSAIAGSHYVSSKAGVAMFTKVLALELAESGIRVNCVAPGLSAATTAEGMDWSSYAKTVPLGRLGQPEDVALAVAFLASDASRFITGATLDVNGGKVML
jgi:NAD(P)-dependent dehydrogenase (short-subunit alcohol dehydrogenase family)